MMAKASVCGHAKKIASQCSGQDSWVGWHPKASLSSTSACGDGRLHASLSGAPRGDSMAGMMAVALFLLMAEDHVVNAL